MLDLIWSNYSTNINKNGRDCRDSSLILTSLDVLSEKPIGFRQWVVHLVERCDYSQKHRFESCKNIMYLVLFFRLSTYSNFIQITFIYHFGIVLSKYLGVIKRSRGVSLKHLSGVQIPPPKPTERY